LPDNGLRVRGRGVVGRLGRGFWSSIDRTQCRHGSLEFVSPEFANRYVVLFVTTRTEARLAHILDAATQLGTDRQRTLILAATLDAFLACDNPIAIPVDRNLMDRTQTLLPPRKPEPRPQAASIRKRERV